MTVDCEWTIKHLDGRVSSHVTKHPTVPKVGEATMINGFWCEITRQERRKLTPPPDFTCEAKELKDSPDMARGSSGPAEVRTLYEKPRY